MKRYSHHNEDEFLQKYFGESTGFFVDIGANDGVSHSNTRQLFDRGWSGVCVEPDPAAFASLHMNYPCSQLQVRVVHAAITDHLGPVTFYQHPDKPLWELNTAHKPWVDRLVNEGFVPRFNELTVQSMRLQDLGLPQKFEFMSVDTEGGDLLILGTLDDTVQPRLICAELDKFDYGPKIHECLKAKGYRHLLDVGWNGFFERV